jgi:co-chaperonin GroES (HSP10)
MSARKLRPTGNRVLVEAVPPPEVTKGGIMLSTAYQQPSTQGTVIAVGGAVQDLKPGMLVAYSWIQSIEVEHEGRNLRLLPELAVQAILEGE